MPESVKSKLGGRIYGCDICQDVCPYNRFATPTRETWFHPSENLKRMRKGDWINLTREQYDEWFADTALDDMGYERLMRNIKNVAT